MVLNVRLNRSVTLIRKMCLLECQGFSRTQGVHTCIITRLQLLLELKIVFEKFKIKKLRNLEGHNPINVTLLQGYAYETDN